MQIDSLLNDLKLSYQHNIFSVKYIVKIDTPAYQINLNFLIFAVQSLGLYSIATISLPKI